MQVLVIGAGVVGLAVGRGAALAGHDVIVAEAEGHIGSGTSSRNSEVIHAGLYYARDSLKASLCVQGRDMLYEYLCERSLPHRRLGKLIVATEDDQLAALADLQRKGQANGVEHLHLVGARDDYEVARRIDGDPARALRAARRGPIGLDRVRLDVDGYGAVLVFEVRVEKAVRLVDGRLQKTSRAAEPDLAANQSSYHDSCYLGQRQLRAAAG